MASSNETDENTVQLIEEGYKKLKENNNFNSLLKKYFTENLKEKLKYKKTKLGATLFDVIRFGKVEGGGRDICHTNSRK
ncbi:unnamed protein product [Meloidogyne enterolobii]|uniref:Uncharacterized protein n=1 Tax=Meloidogyne enterolobii TaxID=390850 RepID=A0ACB0Y5I1_MELEN